MVTSQRISKLDSLTKDEREELIERLHKAQNGLCYVCREAVNRQVHKTDVDHIIAYARSGQDDEANWALAHDSCNRSKGTRDLQLQRILHEFRTHVQKYTTGNTQAQNRNFTLNEAMQELQPDRQEIGASVSSDRIMVSWTQEG